MPLHVSVMSGILGLIVSPGVSIVQNYTFSNSSRIIIKHSYCESTVGSSGWIFSISALGSLPILPIQIYLRSYCAKWGYIVPFSLQHDLQHWCILFLTDIHLPYILYVTLDIFFFKSYNELSDQPFPRKPHSCVTIIPEINFKLNLNFVPQESSMRYEM